MRQPHNHRPTGATTLLAALLLLGAAAGCSEGFDPLEQTNEVLRVIAFAPDKPELPPGQTTRLSALIQPAEGGGDVTMRWEWCPLPSSSQTEYACPLTKEDLEGFAAQAPFPIEIPDIQIGEGPTVDFTYPLPPFFFQGICDQLAGQEVPEFITLPTCDGAYPLTLRLEVEQGGQRVVAVKSIDLLLEQPTDPAEVNTNPAIDGVRVGIKGTPREQADVVEEGTPLTVLRDTTYVVYLDIDDSRSETYTPAPSAEDPDPAPRRENLNIQWFRQDGEMQYPRTAFIEGFVPFELLVENEFTTPRTMDYDADELNLYLVIRDERGGLGWTTRTLRFE